MQVMVLQKREVPTYITVSWDNSSDSSIDASCSGSYSGYYCRDVDCYVNSAYKKNGCYFYLTISSRDNGHLLGSSNLSGEIIDGRGYISGSGYSLMVSGL